MKAIASAVALDDDEDLHLKRWIIAATVVVGVHAALVAGYMLLSWVSTPPGAAAPPLLIDFAPVPAAPESPADIAPGPDMVQSEEEPPPPEPVEKDKPVEDIPPIPQADVVLQPEKPVEQQEKPKPLPKPVEPKPIPKPKKAAAPQTTANPVLSQRSRAAAAPSPGAAAASNALPSYRNLIAAHLQRYKQYPSDARARGDQGTAVITFSVDRNGRVLSRSLSRGSGVPALDAEVMAMIARAQPMPPFPAGIPQSSMSFTVPIRFSVR